MNDTQKLIRELGKLHDEVERLKTYSGGEKLGGWITAPGTWTYASATTITVPSGAALIYRVGDEVRLKQGGAYKYYYIITVADTLLTVTGGTDYTVANAAITDVAFSKGGGVGHPGKFSYTPAVTYLGGTTDPTSLTVSFIFSLNGRAITVVGDGQLTTGGGNRTYTHFTIPITAAKNGSFSFAWSSGMAIARTFMNAGKFAVGHDAQTGNPYYFLSATYII